MLDALRNAVGVGKGNPAEWRLATGPDFLDLLNRLSTKNVRTLGPGEGAATVVTSDKGRILARAFVSRTPDERGVLVHLGSAAAAEAFDAHLKRYTFAEDLGLGPLDAEIVHAAGPKLAEWVAALGGDVPPPLGAVVWDARALSAGGTPTGSTEGEVLLGHDGLSRAGATWIGPRKDADGEPAGWRFARSREAAEALGGAAVDGGSVEAWRVQRGVPRAGFELTDAFNPLEVGLWDAVDFDKGCYVGQEVVARLNAYDKVTRELLRWTTDGPPPPPGATLEKDGKRAGVVTSAVAVEDGRAFGLALVRKKIARSGDEVSAANAELRLSSREPTS